MGALLVVSTPIGNLGDITLRAIEALRGARLIAAEDTRTARNLLRHLGLSGRVVSYHDFSNEDRRRSIVAALEEGDVALISEAGTPTISDPGFQLVRAAVAAGFPVRPIPGASALLAALAVSGLPTDRFVFLGFLPRRSGDRRRAIAEVAADPRTLVIYEAPHRVRETLADLVAGLGDRPACVAREVTKLHEEFFRGTLSAAREHLTEPRGEFTIVIGGAPDDPPPVADPAAIDRRIADLRSGGAAPAAIARAIAAEFGLPRREAYARVNRPGGPSA